MKSAYLLLSFIFCLMSAPAYSQQLNEWFNQKKTQIKYLAKQIAELQIYLGYVKKGYKIVSGGLNTINDIKNGEFKLHDLYYKSLNLVNPRIRNAPQSKEIIRHQIYILKICEEMRMLVRTDNNLSHSLKTYVNDFIDRLLDGVEFVRKDLVDITTDNSVKMTDNARLARLGALYEQSKGQFVFAQKFSSETITMIRSIRQEQLDDRTLKELHGL
ncbi:hypothetical protein [Niabella beijingensis]|uniref:hypothetical protein n=1 Tax=Niabella beijingensis TaxID=2872700 RepID=UPI001CBE5D24|nr:hypothetical protein [Niabella beijingensis]MBZ4188938.1 hypothetical protein [Niabella beijingensis]